MWGRKLHEDFTFINAIFKHSPHGDGLTLSKVGL